MQKGRVSVGPERIEKRSSAGLIDAHLCHQCVAKRMMAGNQKLISRV